MKLVSRYRLFLIVTTVVFILTSIGIAPAASVSVDRIVAVVNNEVITSSELKEAVAEAKSPQPPLQAQQEMLKKMIEKKLQFQYAKKKGISVSPEELQAALQDIEKRNNFSDEQALKDALAAEHIAFEKYKSDLKEQLLLLKLVNREVRSGILIEESELLDYYNQHPDSFSQPGSFKVSQIFFDLPASAKPSEESDIKAKTQRVLVLLQKGGNFQELAKQYSEGPEGPSGGNLGYFKTGQLFPALDQAISKLEVGQFSGIIQSPGGFHIVRLDEKKPAEPKSFESVKDTVREAVYQQRSEELYEEWIKDLWANAYVEIKPQD
jgi:peptidyl-prolyl cis-trans isomerase SurA